MRAIPSSSPITSVFHWLFVLCLSYWLPIDPLIGDCYWFPGHCCSFPFIGDETLVGLPKTWCYLPPLDMLPRTIAGAHCWLTPLPGALFLFLVPHHTFSYTVDIYPTPLWRTAPDIPEPHHAHLRCSCHCLVPAVHTPYGVELFQLVVVNCYWTFPVDWYAWLGLVGGWPVPYIYLDPLLQPAIGENWFLIIPHGDLSAPWPRNIIPLFWFRLDLRRWAPHPFLTIALNCNPIPHISQALNVSHLISSLCLQAPLLLSPS